MGISGSSSSITFSAWLLILALLVLGFSGKTCNAKGGSTNCTTSCGNFHNISYPFRLKDDPKHCGHKLYTLSCDDNITVLDLPYSGKYHVQSITYHNQTIRLLDPGFHNNNCSSMPRNVPPTSLSTIPYSIYANTSWFSFSSTRLWRTGSLLSTPVFYIKCRNPLNSSMLVDATPCLNGSLSSQEKSYGYVKVGDMDVGYVKPGCSVEWMALGMLNQSKDYNNTSYQSIHNSLMYGFELQVLWVEELPPLCGGQWVRNGKCFPHNIAGLFGFLWEVIHGFLGREKVYFDNPRWFPIRSTKKGLLVLVSIGLFFPARLSFGVPILTVFLIYKWRRRHLSMYNIIEDFLQRDNNFLPIRYSYSEIKKMTSKFKDKLGEGGFGSVYKGKLRSGRFVAIKILGKPKSNGHDFTSEVATIGRIHHANVVQLIGYCVEGSKRALVYDFMPNGSLDKYIYSKEGSIPLSCKKMHEISLGIARGINYLHQGCEMQILHFDIKPHNILLDENFNAKVSDFGLAKLYPVDNSIVSLTAARGTLGYIAPELFYKNIGGVSHKADVYSFGMLLMEMASRRKNWNKMEMVEHSSQSYFPLWAYCQYNKGNDLEMDNVTGEEKETTRKMIITSLWCIQMKPSDRPSMNKVIEMLGGDVQDLKMPPRPFLYPQENEIHVRNIHDNSNPIGSNAELTWTLSAR